MKLTFLKKRKKRKTTDTLCTCCSQPESDELGQLIKRVRNGVVTHYHFPCLREEKGGCRYG